MSAKPHNDQYELHSKLIDSCRRGEQKACREVYTLYARAMYNVSFRITRNEEDARDVLQEAFISAFKNLHRYRAEATFGAWLKRIVINKAINALNRRKETLSLDDEGANRGLVLAAEETDPVYDDLSVSRVKQAMQQLPQGYNMVLTLYLLEGYDHQEIASILGITESTSKSQLNRAKRKLKELLTPS